jgi:hypothetical protein
MHSRTAWLIALVLVAGAMLATAMPAEAKGVQMRPVSRSAVEAACSRAGGSTYGIRDPQTNYGCTSRRGSVDCASDGSACFGNVADLLPMPTNSLDGILGARVSGKPIKIGPTEKRITPLMQP